MGGANLDQRVVADFGLEWSAFDQSKVPPSELQARFEQYFHLMPWQALPPHAQGFDLGTGSGRWAALCAPRVGLLHCIDPAEKALAVARHRLQEHANCQFHQAAVDAIPLPDDSMDFGYALGVLHHVPDTAAGIKHCVAKLKPGAPFLIYLYYAFDNRPLWFRLLWRMSDLLRRLVCRLPFGIKRLLCDLFAALLYWPLARTAAVLEKLGVKVAVFPLAYYRDKSFYTLRTDALDRFGTTLEQRFTRGQIAAMLEAAGLERVEFSDREPYWCALGYKRDGFGAR